MALLTAEIQDKLTHLLVEEGLLAQATISEAQAESTKSNQPLLSVLLQKGLVDDELLTHAIAQVSGVPYVNLRSSMIDEKILQLLPEDIAERFMAVPLAEVQNRLAVAMIDANNVQAVDYLANRIQRPLKVFMASEAGVRHVLDQYKTDLSSVDEAAVESEEAEATTAQKNIKTIVQDSPISRALSTILEYAVKTKASDIHIEPMEKVLKIRCRVDGVLREIMQLPKSIEPALVSRIKILSNLKIDEHRTPQDGQFTIKVADKEVDLRIAISPVVWGEQVVIRLLDKTGNSFDLAQMGYAGRALRAIQKGIKRPNGMILTSGPTGSGKSTSLYALIKEVKDESVNIQFRADAKKFSVFSGQSPVNIGGYFAEPKLGIITPQLLARGGAAVALGVLATPTAAILAFVDPALRHLPGVLGIIDPRADEHLSLVVQKHHADAAAVAFVVAHPANR